VLSRLSGEKRVHPPCCRVFSPKNAFIRRVVVFIRRKTRSSAVLSRSSAVLSRLSGEKRVFPAKNAFIRRKSRLSTEKRVHPVKNAFTRVTEKRHLALRSRRSSCFERRYLYKRA
jgi:hypothetical protein